MAQNTLSSVKSFIEPKKFAFIGISRDPKKFSRMAWKELSEKGFEMYPLNPRMDELDGKPCYKSFSDLPAGITHALFMTPKQQTAATLQEAIARGINNVWIQQGAETDEAIALAKKHNINFVQKRCIMMHAEPMKNIHKFHRFFEKLFGRYPK